MAQPEQSPAPDGSGREPSDIFSVREANRAIPTITAVPKTKEEIRRQRIVRAAVGATAVLTGAVLVVAALHWRHRAAIDAHRTAFERDGRLEELELALAALRDESAPADIALAARLHASAALEGVPGHRERAEQLLARHDPASEGASDHGIARTYLALSDGDPERAARHASVLLPSGPRAAEAGHARALAALAVGNVAEALAAARAAVSSMPDSSRHVALLAWVAARVGESIPAHGDAIPLRLARARIAWELAQDRAGIAEAVGQVLEAPHATPAERAWARLLGALSEIDRGNSHAAGSALAEAAQAPPPGDEAFLVQLAEGWLMLGRRAQARAVADGLRPGATTDAARRARLLSEIALAEGRIEVAEAALAGAGEGPRTTLLRARIAEARGQNELARSLYDEAARAPQTRLEASLGLAGLLVQHGRAPEAIALVEALLAERPTHPAVAAVAARAYTAAGDLARALAIASASLREHPREVVVLAEKARIHLARNEWASALEALRLATEVEPQNATLQTERGRAALALELHEEARGAFEAAIAADPTNLEALRSLLRIQLDAGDLAGAQATIARIDAAQVTSLEIERLRGRYFVESLAGRQGLAALQHARRVHRRDRELAYWCARLQLQAEQWQDAIATLEDAMPPEGVHERRDVALYRLFAYARAHRKETVQALADALRDGAREHPMTPEQESRLIAAEAWAEWRDEAFGRAAILARRALELDPRNGEAHLILAQYDALQRRDPSEHLRAAIAGRPPSVAAMGEMALVGEMDAERCEHGRRYVRAAPDGSRASAVRERIRTCPESR